MYDQYGSKCIYCTKELKLRQNKCVKVHIAWREVWKMSYFISTQPSNEKTTPNGVLGSLYS